MWDKTPRTAVWDLIGEPFIVFACHREVGTFTTDLSCFQFAPEDWPQNEQCRLHFPEFLRGYRSSAEAVDTRFPFSDATRRVDDNSVCFNDGFAKVLIMTSICCFIHELESWLDFWFDLFPT